MSRDPVYLCLMAELDRTTIKLVRNYSSGLEPPWVTSRTRPTNAIGSKDGSASGPGGMEPQIYLYGVERTFKF